MSRYICQICGYVYDDEKESVPFNELPENWKCPLCGAPKAMFKKSGDTEPEKEVHTELEPKAENDMREMGNAELSAVCSNLARGCEKQYRAEEAALFSKLSEYYASKTILPDSYDAGSITAQIEKDLNQSIPAAKAASAEVHDRGAARVLTWSEKVTRIMQSLLNSYQEKGLHLADNEKIWVCDICGFIYIGETPPTVCPICKVPSMKILEVK